MKKRIIAVLLSLSIMLVTAGIAEAALATKQISAVYQNMKLYVNGIAVSVTPDEEPFIYNGRTFVPIRVVAEALNQKVEWVDAIKSVKISGTAAQADPNVLAQKDKEIQDLKAQLAQKNTEIQTLNNRITTLQNNNNSNDDDISDLEDDLLSDYDNLEDVEIEDISLDGDEDDVEVDIKVDLGEYQEEWDDLTNSDIENWIEDMVSDIQNTLSDDTEVSGNITDTDSDDVLVDFSKDGDSSLDVTFENSNSDSDADDVEDDLDGNIFDVGGLVFVVNYINYYDNDDSVTVKLYTGVSNASSEWNSTSNSTITSDVTDICEEIVDTFESDADIDLETVDISFYDEDDDELDSFDYDVDEGDLS